MRHGSSLLKKMIKIFFILSFICFINGEKVQANEDDYEIRTTVIPSIPEKTEGNEKLTELKYELSHTDSKLSNKSYWEVFYIDDQGNEISNITDWFHQNKNDDYSMEIQLKTEYSESSDFFSKDYIIKAHIFFEEPTDKESKFIDNSFVVKQTFNQIEKELTETEQFVYQDISDSQIKIEGQNSSITDPVDTPEKINLNSDTDFVFNEANVRDIFEISEQFKVKTDKNEMKLIAGNPNRGGRGSFIMFRPYLKFDYFFGTFSNGVDDTSKYVTAHAAYGEKNLDPFEKYLSGRSIVPVISSTNGVGKVSPVKNPDALDTVNYREGGNGINGSWYNNKLTDIIFFKDESSQILKGVAYDPSQEFLIEITLSLDTYSQGGQVNIKLTNVANVIRDFSLYEGTIWRSDSSIDASDNMKLMVGKDKKTPIGYQILDYKQSQMELSVSYRDREGTYIGDNEYFYTGNRYKHMYTYDGTPIPSSEGFNNLFPFIDSRKGIISDYYNSSHHQKGAAIGGTALVDRRDYMTGLQAAQKKVDYGEFVEYGYNYYFGPIRKGISVKNTKSNISQYEDIGILANELSIQNSGPHNIEVDINLLIDGKEPHSIAKEAPVLNNGVSTVVPYEVDISELSAGYYKGRIEIVNGSQKVYSEPMSINLFKNYSLNYEVERNMKPPSNEQDPTLGNDYFNIVKDSLKVGGHFENNLKEVILYYPDNTDLIFWDGTDLLGYVTEKLGEPNVSSEDNYKKMNFSSINTINKRELETILSSIVLKSNTRGEQPTVDTFKIELLSEDNKKEVISKKLPGALKIKYMDSEQNELNTSKLKNVPDYVYGTYEVGNKLPEFEIETEQTDKTKPYYPLIKNCEFIERQPKELVVSEKNQSISYVYKKTKVNLTINYYQWLNEGISEKKLIEDLSSETRKAEFNEDIEIENKTIETLLNDNPKLKPLEFSGYTFDSNNQNKLVITLNDSPDHQMTLTDKVPKEDFTINYYYEPTIQLNVPTDINFGIREKKNSQGVYGMVPNKIEENNYISIIDTYELTTEKPNWALYASTEGFYSESSGVRLIADILLKTPEFSEPKVITNESTPLFINQNKFEKNISLVDSKQTEGLFVKVAKVQELGKYNGILKYKLQAAP